MKSEFLPTDNRGTAATAAFCSDETSETRREKKRKEKMHCGAEKRLERWHGRPIANGFCGFLARVYACARVHTYNMTRRGSRTFERTGVKTRARCTHAMTYRDASNYRVVENRCPFHASDRHCRLHRTNCYLGSGEEGTRVTINTITASFRVIRVEKGIRNCWLTRNKLLEQLKLEDNTLT